MEEKREILPKIEDTAIRVDFLASDSGKVLQGFGILFSMKMANPLLVEKTARKSNLTVGAWPVHAAHFTRRQKII